MRAAIVLAAGRSRRFGRANKLLKRFRGKPLLEHAIRAALRAPVGRVIVVAGARTGHVADRVRAIGSHRCHVVAARGAQRDSLAAALEALRPDEREALIFLADMPLAGQPSARRLCMRRRAGEAVRPVFCGVPGHPVLLADPRTALGRLDQGKPPFENGAVSAIGGDRGSVADVDRPGDLHALNRPKR